MNYFDKIGLFHYHIPKTAGTSIKTFLEQNYGKAIVFCFEKTHEPLGQQKTIVDEKFFNSRIILVSVRNPHDLLVSWYFYVTTVIEPLLKNNEWRERRSPHMISIWDCKTFSDFINWIVDANCEMCHSLFEWLNADGKLPGNLRIVKYENLIADLYFIFNMEMGLNLDLSTFPKLLISEHKPYLEYYDKKLYDKVVKRYEWAFEALYEKEM